MVFRQIMLGWRTQYFNTPIQRNIAQASSFRNSQVTGVLNLSIYSCFPAYLASFSERVRSNILILSCLTSSNNF